MVSDPSSQSASLPLINTNPSDIRPPSDTAKSGPDSFGLKNWEIDVALALRPFYLYSVGTNSNLRMELARIRIGGQTTMPKRVREAANLNAGDTLSFEVRSDHLVVRKTASAQDTYLDGLSRTLDEWSSPEDGKAWRNL